MIETLISQKIRSKFPYLRDNPEVIYLDSGATSLVPEKVIEAMARYMRAAGGSAGRGQSTTTQKITRLQRELKKNAAGFFGAWPEEFIYVRSATEGLNGIVRGWAERNLVANDQVLLCGAEHHSHLVPWQMAALANGWEVHYFWPEEKTGEIDLRTLEMRMRDLPNLQYVGVAQVGNVLGVANPVWEMVKRIKRLNKERKERENENEQWRPIRFGVDGAQAAASEMVEFSRSGIDFYTFSGHKMFGPTGSGGLLVKKELIESGEMGPWYFGGGAIGQVDLDETKTTLASNKQQQFETGTIDMTGLIGLIAAMQFILELETKYGVRREDLTQHEVDLARYLKQKVRENEKLAGIFKFLPEENDRTEIATMISRKYHPQDVANYLDNQMVSLRVGQHCAQPLHQAYKVEETLRFSFGPFNARMEIDKVIVDLERIDNYLAA